ncbi:MFS transporter [Celerinatantimonas sp. YJH-8]|uniref:MFS transporter n=1 Tax=Celerinatantimonas sp. YJH-8 TaxID=3228714 RepID=UPI0038BFFDC4
MSSRNSNGDNLWNMNFISLIVTNGIFFSGFHLLLPVLPLYVSKMGGTPTQVGLVAGIFVFSAIIIRLCTDIGKKYLGTTKCLFLGIIISFLCAFSYMIFGSVNGLLMIRVVHGVGFGIATTFYATLAAVIIPNSKKGEGMGFFGLGTTVAMAVAPALGLWLALDYSYSYVFWVAVACQVIALVWTYFCHFERTKNLNVSRRKSHISIFDQFAVKGARLPALLTLLFGIGYGSVLNFISIFANINHIQHPGYFFLISTVCVCIARVFSGRIYDRNGPSSIIIPGILLFLVSFFLLAHITSEIWFIVCSILYGFGLGTLFPGLQTQILTRVSMDKSSAASATFYNMLDIGNGCGAILFGMIAVKTGYAALYSLSGWLMVLMLAFYIMGMIHQKRRPIQLSEEPLVSEEVQPAKPLTENTASVS